MMLLDIFTSYVLKMTKSERLYLAKLHDPHYYPLSINSSILVNLGATHSVTQCIHHVVNAVGRPCLTARVTPNGPL